MRESDNFNVDRYTHTTRTGFGSRIVSSIFGVLFGLALFAGSFYLFYWNEGRKDMSKLAEQAVEIDSGNAGANSALNGKLVSTMGQITTGGEIGDGLFLRPGKYLAVERRVEMWAWKEDEKTETVKNTGGSETKTTTYEYRMDWTSSPENSRNFKHEAGHRNPDMAYKGEEFRAGAAKVGAYSIDIASIALPKMNEVDLTEDKVVLKNGAIIDSGWIFYNRANGTPLNPRAGDLRIKYYALDSGVSATVLGKLDGTSITAYEDADFGKLYRAFTGGKEDAVQTLHGEFVLMKWLIRGGGFLMMWIGMMLITGPFTTMLDILPILGSAGRALLGFVTFLISAVLSAIAIFVSMVLHNIVILAVVMGAGIILMIVTVAGMKKKSVKKKEEILVTAEAKE